MHKRLSNWKLRHCSVMLSLLALAAVLGAGGCSRPADVDAHAAANAEGLGSFSGEYPLKVVCTTGQVGDLLRNIGGEHVEVVSLMGPGVDPHLYRAVPSDIEHLSQADAIFYNGLHLEGRMTEVFERLAGRRPTIAVTEGLVAAKDARLRKPPEFEGYFDPHVWHDPAIWSDCATYAAAKLGEFDPTHRDEYTRNAEAYKKSLAELDTYCREQLGTIPESQRVLVTAHDAFGYFCTTFGLESMPLGGISTEEEVSIGRMDEVVNFLIDKNIKAVFVESAVAPRIVEALIEPCQKRDHKVHIGGELYADCLGPASSGADTYTGMIKANVDTIVKALK
jgi:manganese/zinc/iron transport system substrate-binding protein